MSRWVALHLFIIIHLYGLANTTIYSIFILIKVCLWEKASYNDIELFNHHFLDPCTNENAISLDVSSRMISHGISSVFECDYGSKFLSAWYHLMYQLEPAMLVTNPVEVLHCQTISPGWLNGTHPTGNH